MRQFAINGEGLTPLLDDEGREIVYVVPPKSKLDAIDKMLKLMEGRSKYFGLDHADGIAERSVRLGEAKMIALVEMIDVAVEKAGLAPSDVTKVKSALAEDVRSGLSA